MSIGVFYLISFLFILLLTFDFLTNFLIFSLYAPKPVTIFSLSINSCLNQSLCHATNEFW